MSQEIHAPMLADISEAVFGNNNSAAPDDLMNAHAFCACGPVTKAREETWMEFAYKFMKWDLSPERAERWRGFLAYLKRAGQQYTEGYQAGYTAGANKVKEDMASVIKNLAQTHNLVGNLLFDLKNKYAEQEAGPKEDAS